jgi:hypothetical protein
MDSGKKSADRYQFVTLLEGWQVSGQSTRSVGPDGWRVCAGLRGGSSGRRGGNEGAYKEGETSRRQQLGVERERKAGQEKNHDRGNRRNGQGERVEAGWAAGPWPVCAQSVTLISSSVLAGSAASMNEGPRARAMFKAPNSPWRDQPACAYPDTHSGSRRAHEHTCSNGGRVCMATSPARKRARSLGAGACAVARIRPCCPARGRSEPASSSSVGSEGRNRTKCVDWRVAWPSSNPATRHLAGQLRPQPPVPFAACAVGCRRRLA